MEDWEGVDIAGVVGKKTQSNWPQLQSNKSVSNETVLSIRRASLPPIRTDPVSQYHPVAFLQRQLLGIPRSEVVQYNCFSCVKIWNNQTLKYYSNETNNLLLARDHKYLLNNWENWLFYQQRNLRASSRWIKIEKFFFVEAKLRKVKPT